MENIVGKVVAGVSQQLATLAPKSAAARALARTVHSGGRSITIPCAKFSGSWIGGVSGSYDDVSHFTTGQGSVSSNTCESDDGRVLVSGVLFIQGGGTCNPGQVSGTLDGTVSVYRKGPGGGWILVSSSYQVYAQLSAPC